MPAGTITAKPFEGLSQATFQFYNDDGTTVNNGSAKSAINAAANVAVGAKAHLRVGIFSVANVPTNYRYLLECNTNNAGWVSVDAASNVRIQTTSAFVDGAATTQRLTYGVAFVPGEGIQTVRNSVAISLPNIGAAVVTCLEWSLVFTTFNLNDVVQFRVVVLTTAWTGGAYSAQTLDTYNVYPTVNIGAGTTVSAERATVFEGAQLGMEAIPGTAVQATRRLQCIEIDPDPKPNIKAFRPMGSKFNTTVMRAKELTELKIDGVAAYFDMLYLFSGCLCSPIISTPPTNGSFGVTVGVATSGTFTLTFNGQTSAAIAYNATAAAVATALQALSTIGLYAVNVSGGAGTYTITFVNGLASTALLLTGSGTGLTGGGLVITTTAATNTRRWAFQPTWNGPDAIQTYTTEKGSQGGAAQVPFTLINSLMLSVTKDDAKVTGSALGRALIEPFTPTLAGVTLVPIQTMDPANWSVYIGDTLVTMQRLLRCLTFDWGLADRYKPVFTVDDQQGSYSAYVEGAPNATVKFEMENDAAGQNILSKLRQGLTQFLKFESRGNLIENGFNYRMSLQVPIKLINANRGDKDGVYGASYESVFVYDASLGSGVRAEIDVPYTAL